MSNNSDSSESENGEEYTTNEQVRPKWLGAVASLFVIVAFFAIVGAVVLGFGSLSALSQGAFLVLALVVLSAAGWLFGMDLVEKYLGK